MSFFNLHIEMLKKIVGISIYVLLKNLSFRFLLPDRYSGPIETLRTYGLVLQGAKIGAGTVVRSNVFVAYPCNLVLGKNVTIGSDSKIFNYENFFVGDNTEIGPGLHVQTNDHYWDDGALPLGKQGAYLKPVSIGDGVFIGANVTILRGVNIESLSIVGACSLVVKDLNKGFVYAGVPAKKISIIKQL